MTKIQAGSPTPENNVETKLKRKRPVPPPPPQFAQRQPPAPGAKHPAPAAPNTLRQPVRSNMQSATAIAKALLGDGDGCREAGMKSHQQPLTSPSGNGDEAPAYLVEVFDLRPSMLPFETDYDQGWSGNGDLYFSLAETSEVGETDETHDCSMLAHLLPEGADDGIFDVCLPNGDRLGVVVSRQPSVVSYLLKSDSERLSSSLRKNQTELEGSVGRRIRRNVTITVL